MKKLLVILFLIVVPTFAVDYKIVCVKKELSPDITTSNLVVKVVPYLNDGWIVNGSPFALIGNVNEQGMTHLCQCITKDQK